MSCLGNLLSKNTNEISSRAQKTLAWKRILANTCVACSQTLYFLFQVRRVININRRGFIDRQRKGIVVGDFFSRPPRSFSRTRFAREVAVVFEKNIRPQVAQARNISVGERRHCCVTLYKMCVTSLLCSPWADLWPFYGLYCKRFSLYINVHTQVAQARQTSALLRNFET